MNHQITIALLLVKELCKHNMLEDVIIANDINCLRVCTHCGRLMNESWSYNNTPFCSDKCLQADYPLCDLNKIKKHDKRNAKFL